MIEHLERESLDFNCEMLLDATHCNTLQYSTTHCNTLQHTATHCSTLHGGAHGYQSVLQCVAVCCSVLRERGGGTHRYGVALVSRIDKIIGLFFKRAL